MLSIIIPTLNAARTLAATLDSLDRAQQELPHEVIIADGGSIDDTASIAAERGAIFLESARGRGLQMAHAVPEAAGDWLLFLHADTELGEGWAAAVRKFANDPRNARRAGYFRFALDDKVWAARLIEAFVAVRCRWFGLPYGDQGFLISRGFYEHLGGFKRIPLMEDVEIVRRIGRRKLVCLSARAVSSAEKYQHDGYLWRPLRNLLCLGLYAVGVSPRYIANRYR